MLGMRLDAAGCLVVHSWEGTLMAEHVFSLVGSFSPLFKPPSEPDVMLHQVQGGVKELLWPL